MMVDLSSLLISSAYAQEAGAGAPSPIAGLLPFLLIIVVFWFLIIRPQSKRFKEHQAMIKALKKGDRVVTGGGIVGKIVKATEGSDTVDVEIASGVTVEVTRATITSLATTPEKKTAAPAAKTPAKGKGKKIANDN